MDNELPKNEKKFVFKLKSKANETKKIQSSSVATSVFSNTSKKNVGSVKKDFIKSLSEGNVESLQPSKDTKHTIIPIANPWSVKEISNPAPNEGSADALARQAILDELAGKKVFDTDNKDEIVIDMDDRMVEGANKEDKDAPMLIRNRIPGLKDSMGEKERLAHELRMRPEAIDVNDEAYDKMPITDFGMAMLRGMGYDETKDVAFGSIKVEMRPKGLGLGAKHSTFAQKEKKLKLGETRKRKRTTLEVGDHIGVTSGVYHGWLATVIQAHNVPGLEKVLIKLDGWPNGCELKIGKSSCLLIDSLNCFKDFQHNHPKLNENPPIPEPKAIKFDDKNKQLLKDTSATNDSKQKNREGDFSRRRTDKDHNEASSRGKKRYRDDDRSSHKSKKKERRYEQHESWLLRCIRVRIVRERWEKYHLQKAIIEDVPEYGYANLILANGKRLDNVKDSYLHTALPKAGGVVVVVRGGHRGSRGRLLERNSSKGKAIVQLHDNEEIITASMDDVAEYCGGST